MRSLLKQGYSEQSVVSIVGCNEEAAMLYTLLYDFQTWRIVFWLELACTEEKKQSDILQVCFFSVMTMK